jgi:hypothetical protein
MSSRLNLLEAGKSYTFRSFFEMPYEVDDILSEFGVSYSAQKLTLPQAEAPSAVVEPLKAELEDRLQLVLLSSETARREMLVAPVLVRVARLSKSQLRIEYPLIVNDQLKGKLDYLVKGNQSLLVIEAKNDDLTRGFTQLAVELIALSRVEATQKILYGAVTIGNTWLFGRLDVAAQQVVQDISLYRVPEDLHTVMAILIGILSVDNG